MRRYGGEGKGKTGQGNQQDVDVEEQETSSNSRHSGEVVVPNHTPSWQKPKVWTVDDLDRLADKEDAGLAQRIYDEDKETIENEIKAERFRRRKGKPEKKNESTQLERQELSLRCDIFQLFGELVGWMPNEVEKLCVDPVTGFLRTDRAMTIMRSIQALRFFCHNEEEKISCGSINIKGYVGHGDYYYGPNFGLPLSGKYADIDDALDEYEKCLNALLNQSS